MMYASKTPRDLNHDPRPYRNKYDNSRWSDPGVDLTGTTVVHDPRPEFDHVQKNESNPILVGARHPSEDWQEWLFALNDPREVFTYDADYYGEGDIRECTPEMIDHARRVLSRLEAQSTGAQD